MLFFPIVGKVMFAPILFMLMGAAFTGKHLLTAQSLKGNGLLLLALERRFTP